MDHVLLLDLNKVCWNLLYKYICEASQWTQKSTSVHLVSFHTFPSCSKPSICIAGVQAYLFIVVLLFYTFLYSTTRLVLGFQKLLWFGCSCLPRIESPLDQLLESHKAGWGLSPTRPRALLSNNSQKCPHLWGSFYRQLPSFLLKEALG